MKVLVAEDDAETRDYIERGLRELGHAVTTAADGRDAMFLATGEPFDAIILDRMLPVLDGMTILRSIRSAGIATPVLMLTALARVEDRVDGLEAGADDYLVKPFAIPELRARVAALLRRPSRLRPARIAVANVIVDDDALEAMVDGVSLALPRKQLQLLALLVRRKNHMTPKRLIEEALYGFDDEVSANSIEAQVSKLRRALGAAGAKVALETRRGIGYRLVGLDVAPN